MSDELLVEKLLADSALIERLDTIEAEIGIMFKIVAENHLASKKIEKRIAIMQEVINDID
jgi:hypothetical protein